MSEFKAKMYQIQFRLPLEELTALPRPPSWIASKGRGEDGKGRESLGEGRGRDPTPSRLPLIHISGYALVKIDSSAAIRQAQPMVR